MVYWNSPCHQLGHLRDGCGHFKCHQNICSWYCQIPCFVKTKKSIKANGMDIQTSWVRIQVVTRLLHVPCRRAWDCPRPLKKAENSVLFFFFKIPTVQQSPEKEFPYVCVTLATHITLVPYSPCLFERVTIGLVRHNRTPANQNTC